MSSATNIRIKWL